MVHHKPGRWAVLFVAALLLAGCGVETGGEGDGGEESYEWDYTLFVGLNHVYGKLAQEFADTVRKRTDGRLDITVRPAGELPYTPDEFARKTGDGSVQMSDALSTFIGGDCRVAAMPALPMFVASAADYARISSTLEPKVDECLDGYGASLLYTYIWPTQNLWGAGKAVNSLDDIAGKTIRQTSPEHGLFLKALGAKGVTLVTNEVPSAMQRGVMDGLVTAALNAESSQWDEFLDWGYLVELGIVPSYIVVNTEAYEELPTDIRRTLDKTAEDYAELAEERGDKAEAEARRSLQAESGLDIKKASKEEITGLKKRMVPVWKGWARKGGGDMPSMLEKTRRTLRR